MEGEREGRREGGDAASSHKLIFGCESLVILLVPHSRQYEVITKMQANVLRTAETFNVMVGAVNNC